MVTLNRIASNWSRVEREKLNENWSILETSYINVLNTSALAKETADAAKLEATNAVNIANNATTLVNNIKKQFDQIIANQNTSNTEVIAARTDRNTGSTYTNLGLRLDAINKSINDHVQDIARHVSFDSTIKPTADMAALTNGLYFTHPVTNASNETYAAWREEVCAVLGIPPSGLLRFMIETVKIGGSNKQILHAASGTTGATLNTKVFSMSRYSTANNAWSTWRIEYVTLYGNGNPEGSVGAIKGMIYIDMANGNTYFKTTGDVVISNTGWVKVGGAV